MSPGEVDVGYLLDTLEAMVAIKSVLPNEEHLAEYIAGQLRAMGLEPEWHEVAPGRPNVYATAHLGSGERFLVFSGHSDTVGAAVGWDTDPFRLTERDGRLFGLGAYNMKAGLACSLAAFKALVEARAARPSLGRLGFAVTVDQEGHSLGSRALLETEYGHCQAMLHAEHFYGDSGQDYLPIAATGKVLYRVAVHGRAAHAFRPHLGLNAITDAAQIVSALDRLKPGQHPLLGAGTVCTLKIEGGYREYSIVVPEYCEVIITRLTVPGETRQSALRDLTDLVETLEIESRVEIDMPPPAYDPYFLDDGAPILATFTDVYRQVVGLAPHFAGHQGITDANVFVAEGNIPTVVFGPKGANHHAAGEYVVMDTLEPVAKVYVETAHLFLNSKIGG
jgi:acetylornithine deacetylase/succinyl-diaminopimelate desuccinylase-like protein